MNWKYLRVAPWIDTRARFVAGIPKRGRLLDLGSSDGGTLKHIAELRPDLELHSSDVAGEPENYPPHTQFKRSDFDAAALPWPDDYFDAVTCMHVVEHLKRPQFLIGEAARVLHAAGRIYVETPHPRSTELDSARGDGAGQVTLNFYDDPTHVNPVRADSIAAWMRENALDPIQSGVSRNLLFSAAYPLYLIAGSTSRHRYVAQLHFTGWSSYVIGEKRRRDGNG
ncbi:MAG TPA: class I SAM-dependent methyltransferase [Gemmatimonadaceae bacterium]